MRHYGIIGNPVAQSWSAKYFTAKFTHEGIDAEYALYHVEDLAQWMQQNKAAALDGFNVTIPHKQAIIPYLDDLDDTAAAIGAVNVVKNDNGRLIGYNTDCLGFLTILSSLTLPPTALVFGTGGASKAVTYALRRKGISYALVSRDATKGDYTYEQVTEALIAAHRLLINCTPLGMWPDTEAAVPIPYEAISAQHLLIDCIYNPEETLFLQRGKAQGATIRNGKEMLISQAEEAWKIWNKQ